MPYRILMEFAIFLSPWVAYGLYRLAISDAEAEGRKAWPINALFGTGLVLATLLWAFFIFSEDRGRDICREPSSYDPVTQELIPGREYECERDVSTVGIPRTREPGSGGSEGVPETP